MKIKIDYVTNSSSASFVIMKKHLTDIQIFLIKNHINVATAICENEGGSFWETPWKINEYETHIECYTSMDNFDMLWFLDKIGINEEYIKYEHFG